LRKQGGEETIKEDAIATQQKLFAKASVCLNNGRALELDIQTTDYDDEVEAINDD